VAGQKEQDR